MVTTLTTCSKSCVTARTAVCLMPVVLAKYYGDTESALSVFGIVTGIVLPVILFPNTVTNAMASLLLPAVAEAEEVHDYRAVSGAIKKSLEYCLLLGLFSGLAFGVCGNQIGSLLFNDVEAGGYIQTFAIGRFAVNRCFCAIFKILKGCIQSLPLHDIKPFATILTIF